MKRTAYLVNTSRGPLIDEDALVETLRAGRIAGAGLDVYAQEPLPDHHPLRSLPNAVLTNDQVGRLRSELESLGFFEWVK